MREADLLVVYHAINDAGTLQPPLAGAALIRLQHMVIVHAAVHTKYMYCKRGEDGQLGALASPGDATARSSSWYRSLVEDTAPMSSLLRFYWEI